MENLTPDVIVDIPPADRENFTKRTTLNSLAPEERVKIEAWKDPVLEAALRAVRKE